MIIPILRRGDENVRSRNILEAIEYRPHMCFNGHELEIKVCQAGKNSKCLNCQTTMSPGKTIIACVSKCSTAYCMSCLGCSREHILIFARQKYSGLVSPRNRRNCHRCQTDLTYADAFMYCKQDSFCFCINRCTP